MRSSSPAMTTAPQLPIGSSLSTPTPLSSTPYFRPLPPPRPPPPPPPPPPPLFFILSFLAWPPSPPPPPPPARCSPRCPPDGTCSCTIRLASSLANCSAPSSDSARFRGDGGRRANGAPPRALARLRAPTRSASTGVQSFHHDTLVKHRLLRTRRRRTRCEGAGGEGEAQNEQRAVADKREVRALRLQTSLRSGLAESPRALRESSTLGVPRFVCRTMAEMHVCSRSAFAGSPASTVAMCRHAFGEGAQFDRRLAARLLTRRRGRSSSSACGCALPAWSSRCNLLKE